MVQVRFSREFLKMSEAPPLRLADLKRSVFLKAAATRDLDPRPWRSSDCLPLQPHLSSPRPQSRASHSTQRPAGSPRLHAFALCPLVSRSCCSSGTPSRQRFLLHPVGSQEHSVLLFQRPPGVCPARNLCRLLALRLLCQPPRGPCQIWS